MLPTFCEKPELLVASFAEAWIEILKKLADNLVSQSPPSRRRGLKSLQILYYHRCRRSPPSRRRGLKYHNTLFYPLHMRRLLRGGVD